MHLSDIVDRPGAKVGVSGVIGALLVAILVQVSGLSETVAELKTGLAVAKSQIEARIASLERRVGIVERDAEREDEARRQRLDDYRRAMEKWEEHEALERAKRRR